ncbi:MAG: PAS domain-containing protein [Rubrivivax sp.]
MRMPRALLALLLLLSCLSTTAVGREVRVGLYHNPPKLTAGSDGQPSGILGDLLREVARLEGWTLRPVPCEWEACLEALAAGAIDLMPDVAYSEKRDERYDFHREPALHSWSQVYRRAGVAIDSVLDLNGKRVVVLGGSVQQEHLRGLAAGFGLGIELVPVRSFDEGFARVAAGEADAVVANYHYGSVAAPRHRLVPTSLVFLPSQLFFATGQGRNADLLAAIDRHLRGWRADSRSVYFATLSHWGTAAETPRVPVAVWWGLGAALALLVAALGGVSLLRREVALRTAELRRSEQRYRALAELSSDWYWQTDHEHRFVLREGAVLARMGIPAEADYGLRRWEMSGFVNMTEADWAAHRAVLERREEFRDLLLARRSPDGRVHWASVSGRPVFGADGRFAGYHGVGRDVTEQVKAERALQESEERLRLALQAAEQGLFDLDLRSGDAVVSPEYARMLGWEPEAFQETHAAWRERLHPDDRDAAYRVFDDYVAGRRSDYRVEYRQRTRDGAWKWILSLGRIQARDADGRPLRMLGTHTDVTAMREAQQALRDSEARLAYLVRTAPTVIYTAGTSSEQPARYVSPNVEGLLGWPPQRYVDEPGFWFALVHPDDRAAVQAAASRAASADELAAEYRVRHADGRWRWMRDVARVTRDAGGAPLELVGSWIDITERRLAEDEVRRLAAELEQRVQERTAELDRSVERLRAVNLELETFTYSVSHDLKAPLRGIDGYSRLLLADHAAQLDDEGREFLGHIRHATQHMGVLIDDLLSYSRLERRELAIAPLALADVVASVLEGMRAAIDAAQARVEVRVDPALQARADAQGLAMALRNLLDNALKFRREGTPSRITIEAARGAAGVELSVRDNGIGFDMRFHDRIFAIFQRLHRAEDYPGTGIGLAIVRKAVERMGGRAYAHSRPGEGAVFTLQLPEAGPP